MVDFKLTLDQQIALDAMLSWAQEYRRKKEELFYLLDGFAGSGKSYLVKDFLENTTIKNVVVTAPTHKAKKVISKFTGQTAETIQSLLGLRPDVNMEFFNINKPVFNPLAKEKIMKYRMVIIDEASMLNRDAFDLIIKKATEYGVKVLFVGDILQLPPIGEIVSRVFTHVKSRSTLNTIVRQNEGNPNSYMLELARNDIRTNGNSMLKYLHKNPSVINDLGEGFLVLNPLDFTIALTRKFCSTKSLYEFDYIKYLSYTNKSVSVACKGIRKKRIGKDHTKILVVGEFLTGYNTVSIDEGGGYFNMAIENSEEYKVTKLEKVQPINYGIKCYETTIETDEGNTSTVLIVRPKSYDVFLEVFRSKLSTAMKRRGRAWKTFYEFKNNYLLMEDIYFPNGKIEVKKDLYYSYGSTVHKSQGSTYSNTAVNIKNINTAFKKKERNKLLYVALSRTSNFNLIVI